MSAQRFWAKVDKSGECWLWQGYTMPNGYGLCAPPTGTSRLVHRVAYQLCVGPIADGLVIDHLCRVRHCVNPEHLEAVPQKVNVARGNAIAARLARRDRTTACKHGHPWNEANTYWRSVAGKAPSRHCRTCLAAYARRNRADRKARAAA